MGTRVALPSRVPIGKVKVPGEGGRGERTLLVYASEDWIRALRVIVDNVNAIEAGITAAEVSFVPSGSIAGTTVKLAIEELDTEKASTGSVTAAVAAHVALADPHTQYATDVALTAHTGDTANPHSVTKAQVGLGNADNTSDANKPVSTAQATADAAVQAFSIQRANHTGTQTAATISDFSAAADARVAAAVGVTVAAYSGSTNFAGLPSAATAGAGARHFITDCNSTTFLAVAAGGAANKVPVVSDGTNWLIG
jgi:hypothetical protein